MDSLPLVSVVCLCYNQKPYVAAAIRSVLSQTYENTELIIVDDASTDGSVQEIQSAIDGLDVKFIPLKNNRGNCVAFNRGLKESRGQYIIDLAADDVLLPKRIEEGVNDFLNAPEKAGVHFSDAFLSDPHGNIICTHYHRDGDGNITQEIPQGNVYLQLISRYFISPPTMMIKRQMLEELNGYDESLSFEDFDFWIRSSRNYTYIFNKAPLVKKRMLSDSHARSQQKLRNDQQQSTYRVCQKIYDLNRKPEEYAHLIKRCKYEIGQCILTLNFGLIPRYLKLIVHSVGAYRRLSSSSSIER